MLLPPTPVEPTDVEDYRQELTLGLSSAHQLAVECIQSAQTKYKSSYDCKSRVRDETGFSYTCIYIYI